MNTMQSTPVKNYKGTIKRISLKIDPSDFKKEKITSSIKAAEFIRQFYSDDIELYESFFILLLNRAGITHGYAKISQGGVAGTVVDPKIVMKYAIDSLSSSAIICHNHPSGNLTPSGADVEITKKIKSCMNLFDIQLQDHLILSADSYYSFADHGIL